MNIILWVLFYCSMASLLMVGGYALSVKIKENKQNKIKNLEDATKWMKK